MNYNPYFNPELETMPREQLESLQLERLKKTVQHCMNAEFYRKRFKELGITPDDIQTLDDVRKLPFTSKEDLRENYPFGLGSFERMYTSAFLQWYNRQPHRSLTLAERH